MLLALDSLGAWGHLALGADGNSAPSWRERHRLGSGATPQFAAALQRGLESLGLKTSDLQGLVVCVGPGSFTGLRMALSFGQGLAYAARLPVLTVTRFELAAFAVGRAAWPAPKMALDARLDEFYVGELAWGADDPVPTLVGTPQLQPRSELHVGGDVALDPTASPDADDAPDWASLALAYVAALGGLGSARAARLRLNDPSQLQPLYVREQVAQTTEERRQQASLALRPMTSRDLASVMVLERQAYPFPWSTRNFEDSMASGYCAECLIDQGALVGYWVWMRAVDELHLLNFTIAPARQRRGLGSWLMKQLIARAQSEGLVRIVLEVRPSNASALALYRRFGFSQVGRRVGYYPNGDHGREDALVMVRPISGSAQ